MPAFGDFTAELKKRFKRELNLQERNDWDAAVTQAILEAEREIDAIVYQLFALSPEEIRLIEEK